MFQQSYEREIIAWRPWRVEVSVEAEALNHQPGRVPPSWRAGQSLRVAAI